MKRLWLTIALILLAGAVSAQQINIDQNSNPSIGFSVNPFFFEPLGQSFTAVAGDIKWIGMFITNCTSPIQFQLTLVQGSGTSGGAIATQTETAPGGFSGFLYFDFSRTTLTVGNEYTAVISQISANPPICTGTQVLGTTNVYSGGTAFLSGQAIDDDFFLRVLTAVFAAQVQPPFEADGSSTFKAGRVIPVKFNLTADGTATCSLPPAKISLATFVASPTVILRAPFRITGCQYTYHLRTKSLSPGSYQIRISFTDGTPTPLEIGGVVFAIN